MSSDYQTEALKRQIQSELRMEIREVVRGELQSEAYRRDAAIRTAIWDSRREAREETKQDIEWRIKLLRTDTLVFVALGVYIVILAFIVIAARIANG